MRREVRRGHAVQRGGGGDDRGVRARRGVGARAHAGAQQRLRQGLEVRARQHRRASPTRPGAYADAQDPAYDDSSWRSLDLPHDWSIELDPTNAPGSGPTAAPASCKAASAGTARRFTLPRSLTRQARSRVEFDGVYMDSDVYVNGQLVGDAPLRLHRLRRRPDRHGRTPTAAHRTCVAVKVQNQLPSSRWYSGSGIYRNVHLVVTDPVHVARHGVFVTTPGLDSTSKHGYADVHVDTNVAGGQPPTVVNDGHRRARPIVAVGRRRRQATCASRHPHLWSTDDPYLYTLRTKLIARQPRRRQRRHDLRRPLVQLRPQRRVLTLNGRHQKLQGVDLHHDQGALGSADQPRRDHAPDEAHEEHGRQRVPHLAQPAVAGDDRGLPASWAS